MEPDMRKSIFKRVLLPTVILAGTFPVLAANASNLPSQGDFVFKISQANSFQLASANQTVQMESNPAGDEVLAFRDGASSQVQAHYTNLKELDKFDRRTLPNKTKIKIWQDFIILFPYDNPYMDEAKEILNNLNEKRAPSPKEAESVGQKINRRYAFLLGLEQRPISVEKKLGAWSRFVRDFPIENPRLDSALEKINALRKEQERLAQEKGLAKETALKKKQARLAEQNRLAEEKWQAEESARRENERRVEQQRLAEEEAIRKEQMRLAEQKRPVLKKPAEVEVARVVPGLPKPSPKKLTGNEGMALIASGKFVYGEPGSQETRTLNAFYIDVQEVTQKDYEQVTGKNPSRFKGENRPVEKVSWQEANEYCKRTGKRLPTGKEWEKAARAGASSKYYWGDTLVKNNANCNDCGGQWGGLETAPARSFPPNAWGLYDMAGNVWEWVDESHNKIFKVLRGGSWVDDSSFISSAASYFVLPDNRSSDIGFRCAKEARR
jgi:formylglycine-generating enzyme required for sulfatase activity